MSTTIAVTIDLDWASEPAIEETLACLEARGIPATVFATHRSRAVETRSDKLEIGLHPFFGEDSSHGRTVKEVAEHVSAIPHNLPAFRCHRFAVSNEASAAMRSVGMGISSNVCSDLATVAPFRDRSGMLEIPVFLEDGGYLLQQHRLQVGSPLVSALAVPGLKVLLLHPMHFAVNTPTLEYMGRIKQSASRQDWHALTGSQLADRRFQGRGIRDLVIDLFEHIVERGMAWTTLGEVARLHGAQRAQAGTLRAVSLA